MSNFSKFTDLCIQLTNPNLFNFNSKFREQFLFIFSHKYINNCLPSLMTMSWEKQKSYKKV